MYIYMGFPGSLNSGYIICIYITNVKFSLHDSFVKKKGRKIHVKCLLLVEVFQYRARFSFSLYTIHKYINYS